METKKKNNTNSKSFFCQTLADNWIIFLYFWQVWMTSAICTPTALSCRCTWAVTNSPMKANCLRSGRTIASLFLSSWSRYGGSSAPAAHTYKKEKQAQTMSRKRHVNYYPLLFLDDANWLLICPCCSSHWRTDWNVLVTRQAAVISPGKKAL